MAQIKLTEEGSTTQIDPSCCSQHSDNLSQEIQEIALSAIENTKKERSKIPSDSLLSPQIPIPFQANPQTELTSVEKVASKIFDPAGAAVQLGVDTYQRYLEIAKRQKKEIFDLEDRIEKYLSFSEKLRLEKDKGISTDQVSEFTQENPLDLSKQLLEKLPQPNIQLTKQEIEQIKQKVQKQIRTLERDSNRKAQELTFKMEEAKGILNAVKKIVEKCERLSETITRNMSK